MEFTLKQLSPENIQLLLEAAFITVEKIVPIEFEEDGTTQKYWGHVWVKDENRFWRITPTDDEYIQFSYGFVASGENETPEMILLKASNFFDTFPVHLHFRGKDEENGNPMFSFIYSQIFPDDGVITPKQFVKIFRTFQKITTKNIRNFSDVIEIVKEGDD